MRHGETNKNVRGSLHGAGDQESLNDTGREQVARTAEKLKELSPTKIYTSREKRAIETAQILANLLQIPLEEIDGMQERNWGVFSGKSWAEVKKVLDPMTLEERYLYVPEEGESWKDFETRLINAVKKIIEENNGKSVAVITHGGAIRALMPSLLSVPKEESFKYDPDNASLSIFEISNTGFQVVIVNDTAHLSAE